MEIVALYEAATFDEALEQVRGRCGIAALTRSALGSVVLAGETTHTIAPVRLGPLVDTTGAGDLYAAGFLHGLAQGWDPERCGRLGSLCAGQVVTQLGPRPIADLPALMAEHGLA
jgi:fructokinase